MMENGEQIALPGHLLDHNYFLQVIYEVDPVVEVEVAEVEVEVEVDQAEEISDEEFGEENAFNGMPETYTIIPGVRHGTRIYVDNLGFKYYKREIRGGRIYLVCERQKNRGQIFCPCTASISADLMNNTIAVRNFHNHRPIPIDLNVPFLREAIGARGIDPTITTASVRTIYNNEIVQHQEGAANYTFIQAQARVKRIRRSRRPHKPQNIHGLAEALNEPRNVIYVNTLQNPPSRFFQQELVVNGTGVGVIFANLDAIHKYQAELESVTMVGIDGTFKTVPLAPAELRCFLTIQVVFRSVSFPTVYVLLGSMTEQTYTALFNIVRQFLPLNYALITIITDYERGLMNAVQQAFPESRLKCCWFHFTQSIVRYCHRRMNSVLDLVKRQPVAARVVRMVLALPHLPAARGHPQCPRFCMHDGFRAIMQYVHHFPEIEQGMRHFLIGYVERFWLLQVSPQLISVFGEEYRTNNYLESFHSTLLIQMGRHPNIWDFLQKLVYIENQYYVEFDQVKRNLRIRDDTSRAVRVNNTLLFRQYVQQLNEDGDLIMFLRRTGHRNDGYLRGEIGPYPL